MFLSDKQIKEYFDVYEKGYQTTSNTLNLHIAKEFKEGLLFEKTGEFTAGYIGGSQEGYPRQKSFWSEETVSLNEETIGILFGRQHYASKGLLVFPGFIHPGFDGRLLINAINLGPKILLNRGDAIAYVAFAKTNPVENKFDVADWYRSSLNIHGI